MIAIGLVCVVVGAFARASGEAASEGDVKLLDTLGTLHHPVTTSSKAG